MTIPKQRCSSGNIREVEKKKRKKPAPLSIRVTRSTSKWEVKVKK
jgi:hypothetical protein